ncbi:hypothetical protein [Ruminococcus sp.]|uniref:hypothetical protein n=1 Tax=Ruminococcus sp. TaxID=41978 RepID=UPI003FD8C3DA
MNAKGNNSFEHEGSILEVKFTNKETMDVVYRGRVVRFVGELGLHEFMADIDSAKWLFPKDNKITQKEKEEIITAVCNQYNKKTRICFCDKNYNVVVCTL